MNGDSVRPLALLRRFAGFVGLLWLTHALAFMAHEYAHSTTAWMLGCKSNPLALNYGGLDFPNLLLQSNMDENVDYTPIFAARRNIAAATIAMAGVLLGNGSLYLVSLFEYRRTRQTARRTFALFWFLLLTMNLGNFLCYVPIRTFANHADMATVVQALAISPWWLIVLPGSLVAVALLGYLAVLLPDAARFLYPPARPGQVMLVLVCCGVLFGFYGSVGFTNYGPVAHMLSRLCVWVVLPLSIAGTVIRLRTAQAAETPFFPVLQ